MFRRDQSDLDGSFALPDVVPGSYTVVAVEDAWGFDWSKPTLLARYAEHGQALTDWRTDRRGGAFAGAGGSTAPLRELGCVASGAARCFSLPTGTVATRKVVGGSTAFVTACSQHRRRNFGSRPQRTTPSSITSVSRAAYSKGQDAAVFPFAASTQFSS